jgi:hypothetical protein
MPPPRSGAISESKRSLLCSQQAAARTGARRRLTMRKDEMPQRFAEADWTPTPGTGTAASPRHRP